MSCVSGRLEVLFWSLQSLVWDDYLAVPECRQAVRDVAEWYARWADPSSPVLDVGCGTGNHTLALAELGYQVIGLDLAGGMLRRARAKAKRVSVCRAQFRRADLNQGLAFPTGSFGGVLCVAVLQCAHDPGAFLRDVAQSGTGRDRLGLCARH